MQRLWLLVLGCLLVVGCSASLESAKLDLHAGRYSDARAKLEPLATKKNAEALYILASIYHYGLGVTPNQAKSDQLMIAAAEAGYATAQYNMGLAFDQGRPYQANYLNKAEAQVWYGKSLANSDEPLSKEARVLAQNNLGALTQENQLDQKTEGGTNLLLSAAAANNPLASFNAGLSYFYGDRILTNYTKSWQYFKRAYDLGVRQAGFYLGLQKILGLGVEKDPTNTFAYWNEFFFWPEKEVFVSLAYFFGRNDHPYANRNLSVQYFNLAAQKNPPGFYQQATLKDLSQELKNSLLRN